MNQHFANVLKLQI